MVQKLSITNFRGISFVAVVGVCCLAAGCDTQSTSSYRQTNFEPGKSIITDAEQHPC